MGKPVMYYYLLSTITMSNKKITTVGIDISKKTLDIAIVSEDQKKHQKVTNDLIGFKEIFKSIEQLKLSKDTIVIIEATAGYHYGIVYYLIEQEFANVKVINPSIAKSYAKMLDIRGNKTDKVDAIMLAKLGKIHELPSYRETKEDIRKKQILTAIVGLRKSLREQTQRKNHFKYQSKVIKCDEIINSLETVIASLKKEIAKLEKQLCQLAKDDVQIISSIPGVSEKGAACMSTQLGDINRFKNVKQIIAFSGLSPKNNESGTSIKGKGRITKQGNNVLRCSLFQSAWYIYMQAIKGEGDKIFVDFVGRLKLKKLHYYQILCAVAHKLLGIIFALLKKGEKYKENYHFNLTLV
jgi:transposase